MGILDLEPLEFFSGLFSFIFVLIFVITGFLIALKYFKTKNYTFLVIGLGWIFIISGWIPDAINFLLIALNQPYLDLAAYLTIAIALYPPATFLWLIGFTKLLNTKRRRELLGLFFVVSVIAEILFFIFLFMDKKIFLGNYINIFTVDYEIYSILLLFISLLLVVSVTILFSYKALVSEEPEVKLRGKLLLTATILVTFGAALDIIIGLFSETAGTSGEIILSIFVVVARIILAVSSVIFYLGFILPKTVKRIFLK